MVKSEVRRAAWPALLLAAACGQAPTPAAPSQPAERTLPQAGQPLDALNTATRLAAIRIAALTGDHEAVQREFREMHSGMMRR